MFEEAGNTDSNPERILALLLSIFLASLLYRTFFLGGSLPPGPHARFLSGNVHQLPRYQPWKTYKAWAEVFGKSLSITLQNLSDPKLGSTVITFRIFRTRIVVLNDVTSITDLLDGRSSIYSDRVQPCFHCELVGRKIGVFNMSIDHPRFKIYRRMIQTGLNTRAVKSYAGVLERERNVLIRNLSQTPEHFVAHFRRNAGAFILAITYGWTVTSDNDYFVDIFHKAVQIYAQSTRPGAWLVDSFPILRFVPSWFPGASFKKKASSWKKEFENLTHAPFAWTKGQITSDLHNESFVSMLLESNRALGNNEQENIIEHAAEALYGGGLDTNVSVLSTFVLIMVQYPEVQKKAQEEIDIVIGKQRLPTQEDEKNLPYVSALIKELLRFQPVARQGIPHRVVKDDYYKTYLIPKGSTIIGNIWAAMNDKSVYKDPERFNPERYLSSEPSSPVETDPRKFAFGFGKRRCPGENIANASVFLNISSLLAAFTIAKPLDEDGREYTPSPDYTTELVSRPEPFSCRFLPRSTDEQKSIFDS